jgi:hypothetical protein
MAGKLVLTYADYGGEKSSFQIPLLEYNAGNFDANEALVTNLANAIAGLTVGLEVKEVRSHSSTGTGSGQSSDVNAHRELKWLVTFSDDVTDKVYQREIPCPKLNSSTLLQDIGGNANTGNAEWSSFITAFEAAAVSEDGNAVSFVGARYVGRNN